MQEVMSNLMRNRKPLAFIRLIAINSYTKSAWSVYVGFYQTRNAWAQRSKPDRQSKITSKFTYRNWDLGCIAIQYGLLFNIYHDPLSS